MEQTTKEVALTYETLYEMLRKEKSREELQKLDESFLKDTLNYLREKQQAYDENLTKNDIFSQSERDKLHIQITNVKKIIKDLYDIRERKIINMAINKSRTNTHIIDTTQLLLQEQELFESLTTVMSRYRTGILHKLLELREPDIMPVEPPKQEEPQETGKKSVKIIEKVDQFYGEELETYGPFEENEETTLPSQLADILISQGKAIEQ
ncbi:hypothetical protein KY309_03410 [Candidatus Woesearchaeota archaeon]|nr:hypothetical protein [Candidatus Woesearchaeota archaeon]MBW3016630.1 hypothetical protein [Candidatus Woesearchaeota archaeon]